MPAYITHALYGEDLIRKLDRDLRTVVTNNYGCYSWGLQGPDVLYFHNAFRGGSRLFDIGIKMHKENIDELFTALVDYGKSRKGHWDYEAVLAYIIGFVGHYAMDNNCHPYVYWLQEQRKRTEGEKSGDFYHHDIESTIDGNLFRNRHACPVRYFEFDQVFRTEPEVLAPIARLYKAVLRQAYNIYVAEGEVSMSLRHAKKANRLMLDPTGFVMVPTLRVGEAILGKGMLLSALVKKETDRDILNYAKRGWYNPWAPDILIQKSFPDLMADAIQEGERHIVQMVDAIRGDKPYVPSGLISFDNGDPKKYEDRD